MDFTSAEPTIFEDRSESRGTNESLVIPQFSYPGGKAKLAKRIVELLPPSGDRYVEPFAGRANLFFRVAQELDYGRFWLNDTNTYPFLLSLTSYGAYDALGRGTVPERNGRAAHDRMRNFTFEAFLQNWLRCKPIHRQTLKLLWTQRPDLHEWANTTLVSPAVRLEPFLVRDGNRYGKAGVRGEIGGGVSRATYQLYLKVANDIMMRTEPHITWVYYREVLQVCNPHDVVYLDPPYYKYARKTGAYSETLNYPEMLEILLNARFRWVLSEYEDEIYAPLTNRFGEPERIPVRKTMNDSNHYGGKRPDGVECIWRNF